MYAILATFQAWYRIYLIHELIFQFNVMFEEINDLIWFDLASPSSLALAYGLTLGGASYCLGAIFLF